MNSYISLLIQQYYLAWPILLTELLTQLATKTDETRYSTNKYRCNRLGSVN